MRHLPDGETIPLKDGYEHSRATERGFHLVAGLKIEQSGC